MISSQLAQVSALVGMFLPLLISVIQKEKWANWIRVAVALIACTIASLVVAYTKGQLNLHDIGTSAFVVFVLTKTTYLSVWKPSGVATAIQNSTGGTLPMELPNP